MSNNLPPPAPGYSPAPAKKGLGPLAWLGIGCGGIILLGIIAFVIVAVVFGGKLKDFAEEAERNPAKVAAEMVVKFNPELELVTSDEAAGTITFREKSTGKETTLSYQDVADGKLSVTTEDGEFQINTTPGADGSGTMEINTPEGSTVIRAGENVPTDLPSWVSPMLYPNASATKSNFTSSQGDKRMGNLASTTTDTVEAVAEYYKTKLEEAGYTVSDSQFSSAGKSIANITGTRNDPKEQQISVSVTRDGDATTVQLIYSGPE